MTTRKKSKSRRDFIKASLTGLAGAAFLPSSLKSSKKPRVKNEKKSFIHRTLGKTGLKLPIISMGVMNADNPNLVKAALDAGIVHFDTAWIYQRGRNEEMVGQVIKGLPRDSYVIATKIFEPRNNMTGLFPENVTADTFLKKFETSLTRLGLDYVDILYLHNVSRKESVLFEPYLSAMTKLKKEGKARFIGATTHQNEPEVIRTAAESGEYDVVLTAYNFKHPHRKEIEKAMEYAVKTGLGIVGMKAIAGTVENIGKKVDVNAKAALKWALQNENIHTNIPGFTTFDQMDTALSVMEDLNLTPEEKKDLEIRRNLSSLYCQHCEQCLPQCGGNIEIPTLMRSYMYAYGYKNLMAAKETLDFVDLSNIPCKSCDTCTVHCAMGFDVKDKILDISRIKDIPEDFLV